jgi:hypothetical protein
MRQQKKSRSKTKFDTEAEDIEVQVTHTGAVTKELFDAARALVEEHQAGPAELAEQLNIGVGRAFRLFNTVQTQITIDQFGIKDKDIRRELARSAVNRMVIENISTADPKRQAIALKALQMMHDDPFTGITESAGEPDWDGINQIGGGGLKVEDVITIKPVEDKAS